MMGRAIRMRMALASVLPVLLVVLAIVFLFWQDRVQDLEASHQQRLDLLVHQVAVFSAYDMFSGNTAGLQAVVQELQRQPGVLAVRVFDARGLALAGSGAASADSLQALAAPGYAELQRQRQRDVRIEKIFPALLPMEDLYSNAASDQALLPLALGSAVVEVSRQALEGEKRQALLTAAWVGAIGVLLGGLLAFRLGNWVVGPLMRVSDMVKRIGQGNFAVGAAVARNDPLHELQASLDQMAKRLAWGRDELERQVAEVTHALRLKKEQAESATLAKSRFLAAASHDLRQPSHALGMFVARLGQLPMDGQMRQLVDNLEFSVQAMQDLLDGLLDLSRLDAGNLPLRMGPVDVNDLFNQVRHALQAMAEAKGLRLRIRPTTLWADSDAALLQRMLTNLVTNAIRYTEQGSVLVACRRQAQGLSIEVWDSGIGIPAQHHQDIFKEFYQLSSRAGDRNFGLGLGLNIVQRSAELLGHRISLRSHPGCGTRFAIGMEAVQPALSAPPDAAQSLLPGDVSGMRLLLIEDNPQVQEAVRGLLQSWGCQVQVAVDQQQALELLHGASPPDAILSDYHLGGGENGIQAIQALRAAAGRPLAACLMSGDSDEAFLQAARAADLPLLHKPVRPAKLRSLLRHMKS